MKRYKYKAKKGPADVTEGILLAESRDEAIDKINDMGLVAVQIEEESPQAAPGRAAHPPKPGKSGVSARVITHFYRQFSRFIKSGIPLLPALVIVSEQTEEPFLKSSLVKIKDKVREGMSFSKALALQAPLFTPFDIAMAEAGESVGRMDDALARVAKYRRGQEEIFSKVRMALAYPALVISLAAGALVFMMAYVIPKFSRFFLDLGQELPWPTRALVVSSLWLQSAWPWMVLGVVLFLFSVRGSLRSERGRRQWHQFFLSLPKAGKLILMSQLARLCRTLEFLLRSGIPLLKAIRIALPVLTNEAVKKEFGAAYPFVEQGGALSEALRQSKLVPLFVVHLVKIGEESGKLDEALGDIADWYEQEVDENIKIMTQLIEPLIILVVGAVLGFMAVAILMPVFSMNAILS